MVENKKGDVREQAVASFSDIEEMFEQMETTGMVSLHIPNPEAEEDAALLDWLKSGTIESN